ncbi:PhoH family protein [Permianibacter sp. IMCC34836]|uniref:PhoH family protein n=1 Tax=Permianibacter fluminis TaxID=2738515 RepID=UPI00155525A4|nr:PhoH family protein [Permianibacter fluminis]NQD36850.1 PhoH family protein [Permianibacter fluminis]
MSNLHTLDFTLEPLDNDRLAAVAGQLDENLRQIERRLGVEINNRSNQFRIIGEREHTEAAADVVQSLFELSESQAAISRADLHLLLQQYRVRDDREERSRGDDFTVYTKRGPIKARNKAQAEYIDSIRRHDISFGIGPAGTGKTYLAVACAVDALERQQVRRIVLTRPAVEAGEKLGFLPGDLAQKVDPYLRPLYDALYEMLGFEKVAKYMERNVIEVAPLAFMRGRTLNESFVILDESQNTTIEQMKMLLTRIGFDSRAVITGDITQIDLPRKSQSGLRHAIEVLKGIDSVGFNFFSADDVVRHPVVMKVVRAYEHWERKQALLKEANEQAAHEPSEKSDKGTLP